MMYCKYVFVVVSLLLLLTHIYALGGEGDTPAYWLELDYGYWIEISNCGDNTCDVSVKECSKDAYFCEGKDTDPEFCGSAGTLATKPEGWSCFGENGVCKEYKCLAVYPDAKCDNDNDKCMGGDGFCLIPKGADGKLTGGKGVCVMNSPRQELDVVVEDENCNNCVEDCGCSSSEQSCVKSGETYICQGEGPWRYCGDGRCNGNENCGSCSTDCGCGDNQICCGGQCAASCCGNDICEAGEKTTCPQDCVPYELKLQVAGPGVPSCGGSYFNSLTPLVALTSATSYYSVPDSGYNWEDACNSFGVSQQNDGKDKLSCSVGGTSYGITSRCPPVVDTWQPGADRKCENYGSSNDYHYAHQCMGADKVTFTFTLVNPKPVAMKYRVNNLKVLTKGTFKCWNEEEMNDCSDGWAAISGEGAKQFAFKNGDNPVTDGAFEVEVLPSKADVPGSGKTTFTLTVTLGNKGANGLLGVPKEMITMNTLNKPIENVVTSDVDWWVGMGAIKYNMKLEDGTNTAKAFVPVYTYDFGFNLMYKEGDTWKGAQPFCDGINYRFKAKHCISGGQGGSCVPTLTMGSPSCGGECTSGQNCCIEDVIPPEAKPSSTPTERDRNTGRVGFLTLRIWK